MVYLFKIFLPSAFILVNSINSAEVNAIYADRAHRSAEANSISGNANLCRNRFERMIPDYEKAQQEMDGKAEHERQIKEYTAGCSK